MTQIEKRLDDLEKKTNTEGEQHRVIVDWEDGPELPKDDNVKILEWDSDDNVIEKT